MEVFLPAGRARPSFLPRKIRQAGERLCHVSRAVFFAKVARFSLPHSQKIRKYIEKYIEKYGEIMTERTGLRGM